MYLWASAGVEMALAIASRLAKRIQKVSRKDNWMAPLESCTDPLMVLDMVCAETAEAASRRIT